MGIAKVTLNGVAQIDLTGVTVVAETLLTGSTAIGADGEPVTGAATGGWTTGGVTSTVGESDSLTLSFSVDGEPKCVIGFLVGNIVLDSSYESTNKYITAFQINQNNSSNRARGYTYYNGSLEERLEIMNPPTGAFSNGVFTVTSPGAGRMSGGCFMAGKTYIITYFY